MTEELDSDEYSEPSLTKIDELIELSEKARVLNRVVTTDFDRVELSIGALVDGIVDDIAQQYPEASLSVDCDDDVTAGVLPSFERALEELLENAAKHGGDNPTVTGSVEAVPNAVEIRIADDGPGLAEQEADVLDTGTETPLVHGSGLGLWLSHWIITSHGGTVDATVTDAGTAMTISIPRQPTPTAREQLTAVTQARDTYQAAFEEAGDAMVMLSDEARIVDANPEAATLYGMDRQRLLGQHVLRFLPAGFDFDTEWAAFRSAERERDAVTIVGADGETRPVEYTATTDIVPGQHLLIFREPSDQPPGES